MVGGNPKKIVEYILGQAGIGLQADHPWDLDVHNQDFFSRVLRCGSLGLGESYMDGWWDCRALDEFFCRLLSAKIQRVALRNWRFALRYFLATTFNQQTRMRSRTVARRHYNLGNSLFQSMLDRRMVYTCARWERADDLDAAQEAKLDFVCRNLGLRPEMTLLDIGCGWGSLAKFAAERFGAHVTGITLSQRQCRLGQELCADLPIELRVQDYRDIQGTFDRVASLGMFEHVGYKNYRQYFEIVRKMLRPGGFFFLSCIGSAVSVRMTDPWIEKYIFPNSHLPSPTQFTRAIQGLFTIERWDNWREDYDRTVVAWFQNFNRNWGKLRSLYDERFFRMWKYYLMVAAASFRSGMNNDWQILLSAR